jgi:hypothetical protein
MPRHRQSADPPVRLSTDRVAACSRHLSGAGACCMPNRNAMSVRDHPGGFSCPPGTNHSTFAICTFLPRPGQEEIPWRKKQPGGTGSARAAAQRMRSWCLKNARVVEQAGWNLHTPPPAPRNHPGSSTAHLASERTPGAHRTTAWHQRCCLRHAESMDGKSTRRLALRA